jgi:opacity protein-like surface antigen
MRFSFLVTAVALCALFSSAAFALDAAQPTPAADAGAKAAKSADCYRQADLKNLHSDNRRKFYHECMKAP